MLDSCARLPRLVGWFTVLLSVGACGGGGDPDGGSGSSGEPSAGGASTSSPNTTSTNATTGTNGTSMGGSGTTGDPVVELPEPFPDGSGFEYRGIVNLVNAEAAAALDAYLLEADRYAGSTSDGTAMEMCSRLFFAHYRDEYDFVYYINDHGIDTTVRGLHAHANRPSLVGTGLEEPLNAEIALPRTRSVVAIQIPNFADFPPFAHELMHHFGVGLSEEFGFSRDIDTLFSGHWGMTSANGQLGGFDPSSLECESPAGAKPPDCSATTEGRVRYVVDRFFPNTVAAKSTPYSSLELYLMGLLPATEVTEPILRFDDADFNFDEPEYAADGRLIIEASGISEILLSDIIARHGEVPLLPEEARHFKAAFVLITAQPATQAYLDQVADWAAIFSGDVASTNSDWVSFAELTGGRATLSSAIGEQRVLGPDEVLDFSAPPPRTCSPELQDCASGLACYGRESFYCAVPGSKAAEEPCTTNSECEVGLTCSRTLSSTDTRQCAAYCNPLDAGAADSCDTLCPNNFIPIYDLDGATQILAYCIAGAGGSCDPLAQECGEGQTCTGVDLTSCALVGDTPWGEVCDTFGDCVEGSTCIGIAGSEDHFCQPYCDNSDTAAEEIACAALCPYGAWDYDGYSICIPY